MPEIYTIIEVALVAAFIILFLGKTGLREKARNMCDKHGLTLIADMLDCDFCLSFWTCVGLTIIYAIATGDASIFIPICASPITRVLL